MNDDISELVELLSKTLDHGAIADLRIKTPSTFDKTALTNDVVSLLRHIIFLYRLGHIPTLYASPKRFLKAAVLHYTISNSIDTNSADYDNWRRLVFLAIDRLSHQTLSRIRSDVPKELFLWYWTALDTDITSDDATFFSSVIKALNDRSTIDSAAPKAFIVSPSEHAVDTTYDAYLRDLSQRLYQKNEYYDLILIDSNNVDEYRSKGAIESFELVFHNYDPAQREKSIPQHLRIGQTANGVVDALPVTRNFHLPAAHRRFGEGLGPELPKELFGPLQTSVRKFIGADKNAKELSGDASELIEPVVSASLYNYFWRSDPYIGLSELSNNVFKNLVNVASPADGRLFSAAAESAKVTRPTLLPFALSLGVGFNFIPMQLARGAHAAYTFMAYTANIPPIRRADRRQSFISIRPPRSSAKRNSSDSEAENIATVYMFSSETLKTRLSKLLHLIFNFVPDISLCFDHHLSAYVRGLGDLSKYWFDPCLPIEAISFQRSEPDILVLSKPAFFEDRDAFLTCFGGFCFGISERTQDATQTAHMAGDFVVELARRARQERTAASPSPVAQSNHIMLKSYHRMMTEVDLAHLKLVTTPSSPDGGDDPAQIPTPKAGAVRPNFELWPQIEAEISDALRLYVTALFIYRSIHFEVASLTPRTFEAFRSTALHTRIRRLWGSSTAGGSRRGDAEAMNIDWLFGIPTNSTHKAAERLAIDVLQSDDVVNYLNNLQEVTKILVSQANSELDMETGSLIDNNIKPLSADADYLIGILHDCSERINYNSIPPLYSNDLTNRERDATVTTGRSSAGSGASDHVASTARRQRHFGFLREQMLELLAGSLAKTVRDKIESHCRIHGWEVKVPPTS